MRKARITRDQRDHVALIYVQGSPKLFFYWKSASAFLFFFYLWWGFFLGIIIIAKWQMILLWHLGGVLLCFIKGDFCVWFFFLLFSYIGPQLPMLNHLKKRGAKSWKDDQVKTR